MRSSSLGLGKIHFSSLDMAERVAVHTCRRVVHDFASPCQTCSPDLDERVEEGCGHPSSARDGQKRSRRALTAEGARDALVANDDREEEFGRLDVEAGGGTVEAHEVDCPAANVDKGVEPELLCQLGLHSSLVRLAHGAVGAENDEKCRLEERLLHDLADKMVQALPYGVPTAKQRSAGELSARLDETYSGEAPFDFVQSKTRRPVVRSSCDGMLVSLKASV